MGGFLAILGTNNVTASAGDCEEEVEKFVKLYYSSLPVGVLKQVEPK